MNRNLIGIDSELNRLEIKDKRVRGASELNRNSIGIESELNRKQIGTQTELNQTLIEIDLELYLKFYLSLHFIPVKMSDDEQQEQTSATPDYGESDQVAKPKGDVCPRCGDKAYHAESIAMEGDKFHKRCFSCKRCKKKLDSTNACSHESTFIKNIQNLILNLNNFSN